MQQPTTHTHVLLAAPLMAMIFEYLEAQPASATRHLLNALDDGAMPAMASQVDPVEAKYAELPDPFGDVATAVTPAVKRTYKPRAPKVAAASNAGSQAGAEGRHAGETTPA